eukprot:9180351-Lingulodinium_polyedra.AAC.1
MLQLCVTRTCARRLFVPFSRTRVEQVVESPQAFDVEVVLVPGILHVLDAALTRIVVNIELVSLSSDVQLSGT